MVYHEARLDNIEDFDSIYWVASFYDDKSNYIQVYDTNSYLKQYLIER